MKITPATLPQEYKSSAERKVFDLFKELDLGDSWYCYHSLRIPEHSYKLMGEIDFVLCSKEGLFVIEVKGGGVSCNDHGIWSFMDRTGMVHRRKESPFEQAISGMYSLKKQIETNLATLPNLNFGYAVAFPDCDFRIQSAEWAKETIFDFKDFKSLSHFKRKVIGLLGYWRRKKSVSDLSDDGITKLRAYLRPVFDLVPTLAYRATEIERELVSLTQEQYQHLDAIESNDRILCVGPAGSGKTFLAIETAKRHWERGYEVLIVCKSMVLASYLKNRVAEGVNVLSIDTLPKGLKFDVVVVDEGQDLLNFEDLLVIDSCLKGGLENGTWRIFLDNNSQKGLVGLYEESAFEMLSLYRPVHLKLTRNVRNTKVIVDEVKIFTGFDIGVAAAGEGPNVEYHYMESQEHGKEILSNRINDLLNDDVTLSEITLLSLKGFDTSIVSKLPLNLLKRVRHLDKSNAGEFPFPVMSFSNIWDFKGLESPFVILVDIDPDSFDSNHLEALYVAMTRCRSKLILIISNKLKAELGKLFVNNIRKITRPYPNNYEH